jgi:UDP-glucose 4-epimerase
VAYNLGTGMPHSVRAVIEAVEKATGRTIPVEMAPRRDGDPAALFAAPQKAFSELDWRPSIPDLESIVRTAWAWHQANPHGYGSARKL